MRETLKQNVKNERQHEEVIHRRNKMTIQIQKDLPSLLIRKVLLK
jgi:hypothetical protein